MKRLVFVALAGLIVLTGCNRTIPCLNQFITPAFIGFDLSDLDSIVVREYKNDGNFLTLIDSALLIFDTSFLRRATLHDTTFVLLNHVGGEEKYIFPGHDWQIFIPSTATTISLSNIISPQTDKKCFAGGDMCPGCENPINSFIQNGQQVVPLQGKLPYTGGSFYMAYIHPH